MPSRTECRGGAPRPRIRVSASRIGLLLGCLELAGVAGPMLIGSLADRHTAYRGLLAACPLVALAAFIPLELTTLFPVQPPLPLRSLSGRLGAVSWQRSTSPTSTAR